MGEFMVLRVVTGTGSGTQPRAYTVGTRNDEWSSGRYRTAEVIAFNSELSSTDQSNVGSYLSTKYGIDTTYDDFYIAEDLSITNTVATNILSTTAELQGVLHGPGSVFTVRAYWSKYANDSAADWVTDVTASSVIVGTYTNVSTQAVSVPVSGLDRSSTYYYTLRAYNEAVNIWASPEVSFATSGLGAQPSIFRFR
jgi:hypothetical protein